MVRKTSVQKRLTEELDKGYNILYNAYGRISAHILFESQGCTMNFFRNRTLLCICASFLAFLVLSAYASDALRPILVCACLIFLAVSAAFLFIWHKYKKLPFNKTRKVLLACILASATALILPLFMFNLKNADAYKLDGQNVSLKATVTKLNTEQSEYSSFIARVNSVNDENADFSILVFTEFSPQIKLGDIFICNAMFDSNIDSYYYSKIMLRRQNILYNVRLSPGDNFEIVGENRSLLTHLNKLSNEIGYIFDRTFSPDTSALAKALLLGDRHELPDILSRDFTRVGISHLLALSGMHLALITGFIMSVLKYFMPNPKVRFVTVALLSAFIVLFTGASASILRAGLMLIYYQAGYLLRDRSDILTTLFAITTFIVLFDPYAVFDTGLILSFAATFGIALLLPVMTDISLRLFGSPMEQSIPVIIVRYCFESVCISFSAGIFVTVATAFMFDRVSRLSTLTTLLFNPFIVILMLTAAFSVLNIPYVSSLLVSLSELTSDTIASLASRISSFDNIMISTNSPLLKMFVAVFCVIFIVSVVRNISLSRFTVYSLICNLSFIAVFIFSVIIGGSDTPVSFIAQEKDNGIFISDGYNSTYIDISGGTSDINAVVSAGVYAHMDTDLDLYMLTHFHYDHISAIRKFNNYMLVRKLLMPYPQNETDKEYAAELESLAERSGIEYEYYDSLSALEINGINISFLPLVRKTKTSHPSIAFSLEKEDTRIVFSSGYSTSNKGFDLLEEMLSDTDMLLCATHGSKVAPLTSAVPEDCQVLIFTEDMTADHLSNETLLPYCICEIAVFD